MQLEIGCSVSISRLAHGTHQKPQHMSASQLRYSIMFRTPLLVRDFDNVEPISWLALLITKHWGSQGAVEVDIKQADVIVEAFDTSWTWNETKLDLASEFCGGELIFPTVKDPTFQMMHVILPRAKDIVAYHRRLPVIIAPVKQGKRIMRKYGFKLL